MYSISHSIFIKCAPAEVSAFALNYINDPAWRHGVNSMVYCSDEPPCKGIRTIEVMQSFGYHATTIAEITEHSQMRTAFTSVEGPIACFGSRELSTSCAGTCFTYSLTLNARGIYLLFESLIGMVIRSQVQKDLLRLKNILEYISNDRQVNLAA